MLLVARRAIAAAALALLVPGRAAAQDPAQLPPLPIAPEAPPPNVATSPDGSVSVTRTPERGVDVHAPTAQGTVHAWGCDRVDVDARTRTLPPGQPCPQAAPTYAYGYAYAYPYAVVYPTYVPPRPVYYYPPPVMPPRKKKPQHPPDPARTGALIASSLVFGLGTAAAGGAYIASASEDGDHCFQPEGCTRHEASKPALYAMGAIMTVTPSLPRYVVGEVGTGLLLTALRGGSFALGAFVDWDDDSYTLPVTLAFVIPATLGIVDLATTPRRYTAPEDKPHSDSTSAKVRLRSLGPTATVDKSGALAPALGATGTF